jgi:hypothetical protein
MRKRTKSAWMIAPVDLHSTSTAMMSAVRRCCGMATGSPSEWRLQIRQPHIIRQGIAADRNRMAAAIVSAIDQDAALTLRNMGCSLHLGAFS